jgi:hypothetical protein
MIFSLEVFKEKGFNPDLTGNIVDLVLFRIFHLGLDYKNYLFHLVFQYPNKTYFLNIWFSKKRAKDYFYRLENSTTYTKHILGSY